MTPSWPALPTAPWRTLVTGGGGFLGNHLCAALDAAGHEVHAVLRPGGSRWRLPGLPAGVLRHEVDLLDFPALLGLLRTVEPQVILHAAVHDAHDHVPLRELVAANVLSTVHLLEAAAEVGYLRLVYLASSLEHGPAAAPHREEDPMFPVSRRGASKAAATLLARQQACGEGRPLVVVRPFHVYGPWEDPRRLVPRAVRAALTGTVLPLTSACSVDFVYAGDVAEACLLAAALPAPTNGLNEGLVELQIGGGRGWSPAEIAAAVETVVGSRLRTRRVGGRKQYAAVPPRVADATRARRLLGWTPRHDLHAGLERCVEWVRRHQHDIPWGVP